MSYVNKKRYNFSKAQRRKDLSKDVKKYVQTNKIMKKFNESKDYGMFEKRKQGRG